MKKSVLLFLVFLLCNKLFAISFAVGGRDLRLQVFDSYMIVISAAADIEEKIEITQETVGKMLYINFNYDGDLLTYFGIARGQHRCLVLYLNRHYALLYGTNNKSVLSFAGTTADGWHVGLSNITATSELKEGNIVYSAKNLIDSRLSLPWVEGVPGSGIGEKLTFTSRHEATVYSSIIISNGFVDYDRPHLYGYNNRVKKIRVSCSDSDEYADFELEDTPQLQKIDLDDKLQVRTGKLTIEILDVYKGSRWDDTCISTIILWGRYW